LGQLLCTQYRWKEGGGATLILGGLDLESESGDQCRPDPLDEI